MRISNSSEQAEGSSFDGTRSNTRRQFLRLGSAAAATAVAGCLGSGGDGGGGGSGSGVGVDPDSEPDKPDSLVMRAWGGVWQESIEKSIAKSFTDATGIEVTYDNTNFQVIQNQVKNAIDQDRAPPVNVVWTQSLMGFSAYQGGYTQNLHPDLVPAYDQMIEPQIPDEYAPDNGHIPYVSMYGYTYPINYNADALESAGLSKPETWSDWWNSEYEGEIGLYTNATGLFRPLAHVAGVELDPDMDRSEMQPMWDKLEELKPNVGLVGSDPPLTNGLREGEISLTHFLPNNVTGAKQDGEPVDWYLPEGGSVYQTDGFYVPGGQSESEAYWSQVFMNHAMKESVQQEWYSRLQTPMLNQNVSVPDSLSWQKDDPAFPTSKEQIDALWSIDPMMYAKHRQHMVSKFSEIIKT
jgi:putative spermidine/putrescine transport system substrate-binding protein